MSKPTQNNGAAGADAAPSKGKAVGAESLATIRTQIDAIDAQLCDLIGRRTALSKQVAVAKRAQGSSRPFRPAREAEIVRARVEALRSQLPVVSVARIWRELIAGAIEAHQGGLAVLVTADGPLWDLSREHFGSAPRLELCPDMPVLLRRMRENERTVAVMPLPFDEDPAPWWAKMMDTDGPPPRVIARLPFVARAPARPGDAAAVAVAAGAEPEASGADMTMLIVEYDRDYSRASVAECMRNAGWTVHDLMSWRAPDNSPINRVMVELDGFVAPEDDGLVRVYDGARGNIVRIVHFGCYPVQLTVARPAADGESRDTGDD